MKDFFFKNKYAIVFLLTVISDFCFQLQSTIGVPPNFQFFVRSIGLFVAILLTKVQAENLAAKKNAESNQRVSRSKEPFIVFEITPWAVVKEMLSGFFEHISSFKNLTTSNGPSHILLGGAVLLIWCTFNLPGYIISDLIILFVGSLTAFGLGMAIELFQKTYFGAPSSKQDIMNTGTGYFIFFAIGYSMVYFKLPTYIFVCSALSLVAIAIAIHKPSQKV